MTLSIMESHDIYKAALREYQSNPGEIPKILERYLEYVAQTGKPLFSWELIHELIIKKFESVVFSYNTEKPVSCIRSSSSSISIVEELKDDCFKVVKNLKGVPFTIQRICELLLDPKNYYSRLDKFLRGFLRVVKVVTVVDRRGEKITTEPQLLANSLSPKPVNESGDSWSRNSLDKSNSLSHTAEEIMTLSNNINDESSGLTNHSIDTSDINRSNSPNLEIGINEDTNLCNLTNTYQQSSQSHSQLSSSSSPQNQVTSNQYYQKQSGISMPPIRALLKPIDQLEAFVQNVPVQVESSSSNNSNINSNSIITSSSSNIGITNEVDDLCNNGNTSSTSNNSVISNPVVVTTKIDEEENLVGTSVVSTSSTINNDTISDSNPNNCSTTSTNLDDIHVTNNVEDCQDEYEASRPSKRRRVTISNGNEDDINNITGTSCSSAKQEAASSTIEDCYMQIDSNKTDVTSAVMDSNDADNDNNGVCDVDESVQHMDGVLTGTGAEGVEIAVESNMCESSNQSVNNVTSDSMNESMEQCHKLDEACDISNDNNSSSISTSNTVSTNEDENCNINEDDDSEKI